MKATIEKLFKEIEDRIDILASNMKSVNPDHWLCNNKWYVDAVDTDEISLSTFAAHLSEFNSLDYEDISDEGMDIFLGRERTRIAALETMREEDDVREAIERRAKYEELKKEFG